MNRIDLDGRVAVITGGSGGIGHATAERMLASGARVSLWDRDASSLAAAQARRPEVACETVDVTDEASVAGATASTMARFGHIDILVNAAGITAPKAMILDTAVDSWRRIVDINLTGTFLVTRAVARHMVDADYGRIVNLGSVAGKEGNPFSAAYSASKAAVHSFTKSLGKELARTGRAGQLRDAGHHRHEEPLPRPARGDAQALGLPRPDGTAGHAGGGRRAHRVAGLRGLLVLHGGRIRHFRRTGDLLMSAPASASPLPASMRYVDARGAGGPEVLGIATGPLPALGDGEVLIRVQAAGVNRVDCQQRSGSYTPPPGANPVIGVEVAGVVVACAPSVTRWKVGDRVCALVNSGGYAEYCAAPERQCLRWPQGYDAVQAAALPETYFTVWANLFSNALLKPGESLLVHGGSSGIGTTAIQLAVALGARVFATAGSAEKCQACIRLGATAAIDYRQEDFVARIRALTDKRGVDVVLDLVGASYFARNLASLAHRGRLVMIAFLGGAEVPSLDLTRIVVRHLTVTGSTLRPRSIEQKGQLADELAATVWPMLDAGRCAPVIDRIYPLEQVAKAHARMESSAHIGKLMLRVA